MKTKLYFLLFLAPAVACRQHSSRPRLYIPAPVVKMDTVHMDTTYTISYMLLNVGQAPLVIDTVTASCGCTLPLLPEKILNPGDSTALRVEFRPPDTGHFDKRLVIRSDTDSAFTVLRFEGYCRKGGGRR